ncbi:MAG: hypothetical protein AAGI01_04575, partial [Myxococcota bacterium]
MIGKALQAAALFALAAVAAGLIYCTANGVWSIEDYDNYRSMRSVDDPIVVALADGALAAGDSTNVMIAIDQPEWSEVLGRFALHGFAP